jgi:hypothetical protein
MALLLLAEMDRQKVAAATDRWRPSLWTEHDSGREMLVSRRQD